MTSTNKLETKGLRKDRVNQKVNQVELAFLLDVLGKTTQPVHHSQMCHQFYREHGASSYQFCFRRTAKVESRPANSPQENVERLRLQGTDT